MQGCFTLKNVQRNVANLFEDTIFTILISLEPVIIRRHMIISFQAWPELLKETSNIKCCEVFKPKTAGFFSVFGKCFYHGTPI